MHAANTNRPARIIRNEMGHPYVAAAVLGWQPYFKTKVFCTLIALDPFYNGAQHLFYQPDTASADAPGDDYDPPRAA